MFTPLEILDKIKETNKKEIYKTFERETATQVHSELYKKLSKISSKFITTNYDTLIEFNTGINKIDTNSIFNLQKIDDNDEFILKIHGCTSAIDNAVIFSSDYQNLYEGKGLANFQMTKIISSHSCLFIGYSLSDHYLVDLFNSLNDMYEGMGKDHYIITTENISHKFVDKIHLNNYEELPRFLGKVRIRGEILLG